MLTASQDIDNFIERHRSRLNKQNNRQLPPPPPPQPSMPQTQVQDRLDYKVARILDDPPSRVPVSQQPYYPPPSLQQQPPPQFPNNSFSDSQENFYAQIPPQQQPPLRRLSADNADDNPAGFFNKFGTYDDKRSQLKDDLKREYNEFLQKKNMSKSKSTSQLAPSQQNQNKRVQFQQQNGKVVAPWEKGDGKSTRNNQSMNDLSFQSAPNEPIPNRSRPPMPRDYDEQYIRDREEYVSELHAQIRELEARKRQLEIESSRLSAGGTSNVVRAHYTEDLNALNSLLAERLDQRNAVDLELAHILNRPPVSASPTRVSNAGPVPNLNMHMENTRQGNYQQPDRRGPPPHRKDNRSVPNNSNEFQIGREVDKDSEQAAKKRYQQELQAQMREVQMRKAQDKRAKDEYDRKLEEDIQRYNYFGRSGGGAPMRDKDGNVVANLGDVRNPPTGPQQQYQQPYQQQHQQQQQPQFPPDNKVYSLGDGFSSITNAPFYNAEQQPPQHFPGNSDRPGSPNHARGAMSNGMFGAPKTEAQFVKEEKYKLDLKKQIEEKRQREADEQAKRRAEEERELAKHMEWQQQMEKQVAEEAVRKQEKEQQERQQHLERQQQQQLQEELDRQKKQEEGMAKRKPTRPERVGPPKKETNYDDDQHKFDEDGPPQAEAAYRSSSPPIPALKNKDKKQKAAAKNVRRQPSSDDMNQQQPNGRSIQREPSSEEMNQQQPPPPPKNVRRQPSFDDASQLQSPPPPLPPLNTNDDYPQTPNGDDRDDQGRHTYRKPPAHRPPEVSSAHKKPPQTYRSRPRADSNAGMPMRTNSTTSLRSDGSDSEVLNRLEHLKRQLRDKEARLQEHVTRHQKESKEQPAKFTYQPPVQPPVQRKASPQFLINTARVHHHRDSPTNSEKMRRLLHTEDDMEFRPGYFRDDAILMGGANGHHDNDYYSSSKRVDSANQIFTTNIEKEASRRRYGPDPTGLYDQDDPAAIANYELNRIAEQNEQRLKKLRDLEHDDASLLDSNEVLERFQQRQRMQRGGSQTTLQDDAWLK